MNDRARELRKEADSFRETGDLVKAGNHYTAAAFEYAGIITEKSFPGPDQTRSVLGELLKAATCFRVRGDQFRTQNRCDLGILFAEDHIEFIKNVEYSEGSFADLRRGAWSEFLGDFRTIAEREDAGDAYDQAISIYAAAGDFEFVCAEQEHMRLASFFKSVKRGVGEAIPHDAPEQQTPGITFSEWVEYKRERLPTYLDQLEERGEWPLE